LIKNKKIEASNKGIKVQPHPEINKLTNTGVILYRIEDAGSNNVATSNA